MAGTANLREELLALPRQQASSLAEVAHRPWPRPRAPWLMGQSWCDLVFAHWPVDAAQLAKLVPPPLRLETHGGSGWIGITPFVLRGLHARFLPPLPRLSGFCETNIRTYVTCDGRPGIFFLSLDASSSAAVAGGRALAALPYRRARMAVLRDGPWIEYASERPGFSLRARYAPAGSAFSPRAPSLEAFLVERYCLYTTRAGRLWRVDIHHGPWKLHAPRARSAVTVTAELPAVELEGSPLLHVADRQDVVVWPPVPLARLTAR